MTPFSEEREREREIKGKPTVSKRLNNLARKPSSDNINSSVKGLKIKCDISKFIENLNKVRKLSLPKQSLECKGCGQERLRKSSFTPIQ